MNNYLFIAFIYMCIYIYIYILFTYYNMGLRLGQTFRQPIDEASCPRILSKWKWIDLRLSI